VDQSDLIFAVSGSKEIFDVEGFYIAFIDRLELRDIPENSRGFMFPCPLEILETSILSGLSFEMALTSCFYLNECINKGE
jgi:hypothetical protein